MKFKVPFSIDRSSAESLTRQIENGYRRVIVSGACAPGTRLPSRSDLAEILGVSEMVVREAFGRLQKDGLVVSRPHIGCVVQSQDAPRWRARVVLVMPFAEGAYYYSAFSRVFTDLMLENRILTLVLRTPKTKVDKTAVLDELAMLSADFAVLLEPSAVLESWFSEKGMPFFALGGRGVEHVRPSRAKSAHHDIAPLDSWLTDCVRQCVRVGVRRVAIFRSTRSYAPVVDAFAAVGISAEEIAVEEPAIRYGVTEEVQRAGLTTCARQLKSWEILPDLILVPGDEYLSAGVWTALVDAGIRVPGDVRFASVRVKGHGPVLPKALTSIVIDPQVDAERVTAHVLALLSGAKRVPPFVSGACYVVGETFPNVKMKKGVAK